ncbi:MAG: DUF1801 domain-containing protein [Gemmatimonadales bacterium]
MAGSKAKTVTAYLEELPADRREVVGKVRDVVRQHLPKGYEELMGFGMIMYSVPLKVLPDTYNGHPLCYVALAAQKNYYTLHLMAVGSAERTKQLAGEFRKAGKKLDMGKACVRFKCLDDLPLDVIASTVASVPMEKYVAFYRGTRAK